MPSKRIERVCKKCGEKKMVRKDSFREMCLKCANGKPKRFCENCKSVISANVNGHYPKRFCSKNCSDDFIVGENHPCFKDARTESKGYLLMSRDKKVIPEHRWVIEQHLKRKLRRDEVVHHINGIKSDNRIENLSVMKNIDHCLLHGEKTRKIKEKRCQRIYPKQKDVPFNLGQIWIDWKNDYRSYIVFKCGFCGKLWWGRKDHPAKYCSSKCFNDKTGFAKNLVSKYRWNKG
jgi:hypothetical protein